MEELLAGLRAAGEPTRLRLLSLCAHAELSVTELTQILGQSQPRVSRHLKLLVEAGLLSRFREGSLVFYRLADKGREGHLAKTLIDLMPLDDAEISRDLVRLGTIREKRAQVADNYFRENATNWRKIRALHVAEADVEALLKKVAGSKRIDQFLDIGTGTGRMLELFAEQINHGIGIDTSADMLSIARTQLADEKYKHIQIRKGDMYNMPIDDQSIDIATLHLVLHFSLEPAAVLAEATRTLKPAAKLLIIDFAAHQEERLRTEHQHQRLGFTDTEMKQYMRQAGLKPGATHALEGDPLTVKLWVGTRIG